MAMDLEDNAVVSQELQPARSVQQPRPAQEDSLAASCLRGPLQENMLGHLPIVFLARLRASCAGMREMVDCLTADIWTAAASSILPACLLPSSRGHAARCQEVLQVRSSARPQCQEDRCKKQIQRRWIGAGMECGLDT